MGIYLITTGFSIVCYTTIIMAMAKRMKREGYIVIKRKKTIAEKLLVVLQNLFFLATPIINVITAAVALYAYDDIYASIIDRSLNKGEIYKAPEVGVNVAKEMKGVSYETVKKTIKYDHMTTEDKIQYLKDEQKRLLASSNPGVKQGPTRRRKK